MQRGMITFSPNQVTTLQRLLASSPLLQSRLGEHLVLTTNRELSLEVSREEVETLLDELPIPSPSEPLELSQIRTVLTDFLQQK